MNNERYNRLRTYCHLRLGIMQFILHPVLNILLILVPVATIVFWLKMQSIVAIFDVSEVLVPLYTLMLKIFGVVIPVLLLLGIVDAIGSATAKKDEENLQIAFDRTELRHGSPILMYKKTDKINGVTVREYYSFIPMNVWVQHIPDIEDMMNVHLIENLRYGGKKANGRRIVMCSAANRKPVERGALYDDTF